MPRSTFPAIRKSLATHDRAALTRLIGELYALNQQNRDFLEARFMGGESTLKRYKKIIEDALYPDVRRSMGMDISFRDARKAISDYRKAHGELSGLAELYVFAAECGNRFTCDFGDIDGPFYDALIRMFESATKAVTALEPDEIAPFVERLEAVVTKARGIGWGYYDSIRELFAEAFES